MKHNSYVMYDSKSKSYTTPMFLVNDQTAIRTAQQIVNHSETDMHYHPHDFKLFKNGILDFNTGMYEPQEPEHIINLHELVMDNIEPEIQSEVSENA